MNNLELPFVEPERSALDDRFDAVDRELDVLFLEEVDAALLRLRADRAAASDGAVA